MTALLLTIVAVGPWWYMPDEVVDPPAPAVCQCGCGKSDCKCGKTAGVGCSVLTIDDAALASVMKSAPQRHAITVYTTTNCAPCNQLKAAIGNGDDDVAVTYVLGPPPFAFAGYPTIYSAERQEYLTGYASPVQIKAWLKIPAVRVSAAVSAVNVGTIDGAAIRAFLAQVPANGTISMGGAKITIPPKMATEIDVSPQAVAVKFTGVKPRVSYGVGWLSVSQPVTSLSVAADAVVVGIEGWPDLRLGVK